MIKGTLDMLILKVISFEPMHGWGICEQIQRISKDELQVNQGSLYTSLHKLLREGWIKSHWRTTDNNRRARYYVLTRAGKKQLGLETENWDRLAEAVQRIMAATSSDSSLKRRFGEEVSGPRFQEGESGCV
jgi:transcriptional regulator